MDADRLVQVHGEMWCDLLMAELHWQAERERVTVRALIYLDSGLPLQSMLDALKITAAEWEQRAAEVRAARAGRLRAARADTAEMTL